MSALSREIAEQLYNYITKQLFPGQEVWTGYSKKSKELLELARRYCCVTARRVQ
jgi:hypothetical protein